MEKNGKTNVLRSFASHGSCSSDLSSYFNNEKNGKFTKYS